MTFDQFNKKNKKIVEYFKKKRILLVDPVGMNRVTLKKIFVMFGVEHAKICMSDSFTDASDKLADEAPHIICVKRDFLDKEEGEGLLDIHLKSHPNRINASCFVISDDNSVAVGCLVLEKEIDGLFVTPFSVDALEKTVLKSLKEKIMATDYFKHVEKGKEQLLRGDYDKANEIFEKAVTLDANPVLAKFYIASLMINRDDPKAAEVLLLANLESDPSHYKTLDQLASLYKKQNRFSDEYNIMGKILNSYPTNPEKIPHLTRLSILNQKYEDILRYTEIFLSIENASENIRKYISAGLAICARFMISNDELESAKRAIEQSAKYANGKIEILENLAESFMKSGDKDAAVRLLETYATEETAKEDFMLLQFSIFSRSHNPAKVFEEGRRIISKGFRNPKVYHILLDILIDGGSKFDRIEDIAFEATKAFPKLREEFMSKVERARSN